MMNQNSVIILGAGDLSGKRIGPSPHLYTNDANLAVGSQLARKRIIDHYKQQDKSPKIYLIATQENGGVRTHLSNSTINILYIKKQNSILESIKEIVNSIDTPYILLQPITTIPSQQADQTTWIEVGKRAIPRENWSGVIDPECQNPKFLFKNLDPKDDKCLSHPFTGIINAPTHIVQLIFNTQDLYNQLRDKTDLLCLAEKIWQIENTEFRLTEWHDLGHYSTYSQASAKRLESRSFNHIKLYADKNIIYKSSTDLDRLNAEASYLKNIDDNLKRFFPRLLRYEQNKSMAKIHMEYIPYPNLGELFLHWDIGRNTWFNIMEKINLVINEIQSSGLSSNHSVSANTDWLYSKKLIRRQEQIRKFPPDTQEIFQMGWNEWCSREFSLNVVNSKKLNSNKVINLPALNQSISRLIDDLIPLENDCQLRLIHGDLCFNNILVEPMSCSIKLIDPRGELPKNASWPIGYGDCRYDLIKILHSSRYLYDVIVNDLFELNGDINGNLILKLDIPSHYKDVDTAINANIIQNKLSSEEERLLVSSLFLSMLPLHKENPRRCLAFSCIGLLILEKKFNDVVKFLELN